MRWIFALALLLAGCGASSCSTALVRPAQKFSVVAIEPQVARTLAVLHYRLVGHPQYPDHEWALCLRVRAAGDTLRVYDLSAADIESFTTVADDQAYRRIGFTCSDELRAGLFGAYHNHPSGSCEFSSDDLMWQEQSAFPLMVISCGFNPAALRSRILNVLHAPVKR